MEVVVCGDLEGHSSQHSQRLRFPWKCGAEHLFQRQSPRRKKQKLTGSKCGRQFYSGLWAPRYPRSRRLERPARRAART